MNLSYVICNNCGYITLFPRLTFNEYETYYKLAPAPSPDAFLKRAPLLEVRKTFILSHIGHPGADVVVEIGPAYGDFLLLLSNFERRVGIEPSLTCCEFIESAKLPLEYHCCLLEHVPEAAGELLSSADLAVASNVLEHAFDPRIFIRALASLVKPGGYLYIEVPSVEAMAESIDPLFQTIHCGHISQFSRPVLNRLCISESLEQVTVECSATDRYPVIRALYKKSQNAESIAELFRRHCINLDRQTLAAKEILVSHLYSSKREIAVWGCGQDLLDVVTLLDDSEKTLFKSRAKLVDRNLRKQGKKLAGMEIQDPGSLLLYPIDAVLISSRSELIQADIIKEARREFPDMQAVLLYPVTS